MWCLTGVWHVGIGPQNGSVMPHISCFLSAFLEMGKGDWQLPATPNYPTQRPSLKHPQRDLRGGLVGKISPSNAGGVGSIPGEGN